MNAAQRSILITDACSAYTLPQLAANILIEGLVNPKSVKTTGNFTLDISDQSSG